MDKRTETLIVRALNHARSVSLPAYIGLRCFAEDANNINNSTWGEQFFLRKLVTTKNWRFSRFNVVKSASPDRRDYRPCVVGSPISLLVEALILRILSQSRSFSNKPSVFSYRWPSSDLAGGNFDWFTKAYRSRNSAVRTAL